MKWISDVLVAVLACLPMFILCTWIIFRVNKWRVAIVLKGKDDLCHEALPDIMMIFPVSLQLSIPLPICAFFIPPNYPDLWHFIIFPFIFLMQVGAIALLLQKTDERIRKAKKLPAEERIKLLKDYGPANNHC